MVNFYFAYMKCDDFDYDYSWLHPNTVKENDGRVVITVMEIPDELLSDFLSRFFDHFIPTDCFKFLKNKFLDVIKTSPNRSIIYNDNVNHDVKNSLSISLENDNLNDPQ